MFHRVNGDRAGGPFDLAVTPETFRSSLLTLARAATAVEIGQIKVAKGMRFAVTFDDGYADNYEVAAGIAAELGVPIAVYVTSATLGGEVFWWDRLATVCKRAEREHVTSRLVVEVEVAYHSVVIAYGGEDAGDKLMRALHVRLREQPPFEIEGVIDEVARQLGVDPAGDKGDRTLTEDELRALAGTDGVTIGAHTTDHAKLSTLSRSEQKERIETSRDELARLTGEVPRHFAYPFGSPADYDSNSVEVARACGFETAVTTTPGMVTRFSRPFELPRYVIDGGHSAEDVVARAGLR